MNVKTKTQALVEVAVSDTDKISLTVMIGNSKMGGSIVKFIDKPEDILALGGVEDLPLGNRSDIEGRTLSVITNILDSNGAPNMIAKHLFANSIPNILDISGKVDNVGDIFSWEATYLFK